MSSKMKRNNFNDKIKTKCLQCCDRYCCLCGKQCSTNIEIHHIVPIEKKGDSSFENAIPLCFDCHAKVQNYNKKHPKGNKYQSEELRAKRDQTYNKYTSPFIPNMVHFEIRSDDPKTHNKARFFISNMHPYLPCKVKTIFSIYHKDILLHKFKDGVYGGKLCWNLNPTSGGNFPPNFLVLKNMPKKVKSLQVQVEAIIVDKFGREHELLPVSWVWNKNTGWYFHPFSLD